MTATLFYGAIVTMDEAHPDPQAVLVVGDTMSAVGPLEELRDKAPTETQEVDLGDRALLPGLIEPHSHPTATCILLGPDVVDIRSVIVTSADEVWGKITGALANGSGSVLASGWDPLLQTGLENPTMASLDELAGGIPLVIFHNSGHTAYFNSAAAERSGVDSATPDPSGASFSRDEAGELTGRANETAAVGRISGPALASSQAEFPDLLVQHLRHANSRGVTTMAELAFEESSRAGLQAIRDAGKLSVRLRLYETSSPGARASTTLDNGDDLLRQIGIKTWADGSPWVGNIATSFPYLNTEATAVMGLGRDHYGQPNYDRDQLVELARQYVGEGWQLACHVHGDLSVDDVLDAWEQVIEEFGLTDHRFRLEHVGAMTPAQFERAATLGVSASLFIDHVYYWGDVLVDDLFGPEHGSRWTDAKAAFDAGLRPTFHNDGSVTPLEPFRNMATAITRLSRSGRRLDGAEGVTLDQALAAHTTNAAHQLFADESIGSITPGKYADLIVVDRDPRRLDDPADIAQIQVEQTYLAGALVFSSQAQLED